MSSSRLPDFSKLRPKHRRILGALLGVHAGDSLGATLEFTTYNQARSLFPNGLRNIVGGGILDWPPGHATDDTDLTRAVLLAYLDEVEGHLPKTATSDSASAITIAAAEHMLDWMDGKWPDRTPGALPRDIGGATHLGLNRYRETRDPLKAGAGEGQAGNGSLMRCIPTALFTTSQSERYHLSIEISAITHDDLRCSLSCALYNDIVAALVAGKGVEEALHEAEDNLKRLSAPADAFEIEQAVQKGRGIDLRRVAREDPHPLVGKCRGYVLDSLALAIAAVLDPRPMVDVLADIVSIGADSDTNAAIAGGLLGARDGVEGIPKDWLAKLQFAEEFVRVVEKLVERRPELVQG